jgi:hypothetical protein
VAQVQTIQVQTDAGVRSITPAEYIAMPSVERTALLLRGKLKFLDAAGNQIKGSDAIKTLK